MTDHEQPAAGVALKPCPFCGCAARMWPASGKIGVVGCGSGSPNCPAQPFGYLSEAEAIAAWNTRAPTDAGGAVSEADAWRWEQFTNLSGAWTPRLTDDRPDDGPRVRNVRPLFDRQAPHPLQQGGEVTREQVARKLAELKGHKDLDAHVVLQGGASCPVWQFYLPEADAIQALFASLAADRDKAVGLAEKLSVAISWLDYPFVDNNTPEDELRRRVGLMMKDAEPHRVAPSSQKEVW